MSEAPEFQVVANLLALLADGKATAKKFDELRQTIERAEAAAAKLETARAAHEATVAATKADLDARGAQLLKRETAVGIAERDLVKREKAIAAVTPPRFAVDPNGGPGTISYSGLAREAHHG